MRSTLAAIFRLIFRIPAFRGVYYGMYKRLFRPKRLFRDVRKKIKVRNKFKMELEIEDWVAQNIYFLGAYEESELRFVEHFLKPGDTFLDIGANIGLFSLTASLAVGKNGRVIAFEPFSRNYSVLTNHVSMNRFANIHCEKLAVSDQPGTLTLKLNENEKNFGMVSGFVKDYTTQEEVETVTIDDYLRDKNIRPAIVKLDIEGAEYLALKGMRETLNACRPAILIEINPGVHDTDKDPGKLLLQYGYTRYFIDNKGGLLNEFPPGETPTNFVFLYGN